MARETEIKLKISDVPAFHRAFDAHSERSCRPRNLKVHEENVIFDTRRADLPSTDNCCAFERRRRSSRKVEDGSSEASAWC